MEVFSFHFHFMKVFSWSPLIQTGLVVGRSSAVFMLHNLTTYKCKYVQTMTNWDRHELLAMNWLLMELLLVKLPLSRENEGKVKFLLIIHPTGESCSWCTRCWKRWKRLAWNPKLDMANTNSWHKHCPHEMFKHHQMGKPQIKGI